MPTYEYACKSCGEHLEVVQSFKDDPLTGCPACGGPLRKVFGSIGIAFRGSGFYRTDSRSSSSSSSKGEGSGRASDSAAADAKSSAGESKSGETKSSSGDGGSSGKTDNAKTESKSA